MSNDAPSGEVPHTTLSGDRGGRVEDEGYVDSESRIEGSDPTQNTALWFAVLGPPVIWFLQMQTSYSLVTWACSTGRLWSIHVTSAAFLVLAAVPGLIGWKEWNANAAADNERRSTGRGRRRFMAMLGMMLAALFLMLIVAQAIPSFFVDPCLE